MSTITTKIATTNETVLKNLHLTAISGNAKTGNIPVISRPMETCPNDCPFLPESRAKELIELGKRDSSIPSIGGCYGTGRIFGMARKFSKSLSVSDMRAILARAHKSARYLRDRVVGDLMTENGEIDHNYIETVANVSHEFDLTPFGYTHAWRKFSHDDVNKVKETGYVLNASCESRDDVKNALFLGFPAVIASDIVKDGETFTRNDGETVRIVTCPAQTRENVTCASCGLCAKSNRKSVVRFNLHGTSKKRASKAVEIREGK